MATDAVSDYALDFHKLGPAVIAVIDSDQRDALTREKFIAGLLPYLREFIIYSNPQPFTEVMTLAERLKCFQASKADNTAKHALLLENINHLRFTAEHNLHSLRCKKLAGTSS